MAELYQVLPIEGKGFGIVASQFIERGSLILKEKPQMPHVCFETPLGLKQAKTFFDQMSQADQKEYLELYNKYESEFAKNDEELKMELLKMKTYATLIEKDPEKAEKMLKIVCIYRTNSFQKGLCIKTSRFNHSCQPNAVYAMVPEEVRAISDIKSGQEITISYGNGDGELFGMKNKESRQKFLKTLGFICNCDLCKQQGGDGQTIQFKIDELIEEAEKLKQDQDRAKKEPNASMMFQLYPPEKCRKQIDCYKQLYKLGKEAKVHPWEMYDLLRLGYDAAFVECKVCWYNESVSKFFEEFETERVKFAKTAEAFGKFLGKEVVNPEDWRKCHQNFKSWFFF